jgi:DNA-binding NarL/FixJ family response regulator
MKVPVLIYEDNHSLRESIAHMVRKSDYFSLASAFENATNVTAQLRECVPGIILMDIDMPCISGIDAVKQIRKTDLNVPIIMLTVFDDNAHVFDALKSGASGYLLKKHISMRLFDAMKEVLDGGAPMSPSIARMVLAFMQGQPVSENPYSLTPREKDILCSLSKGNSYKLIGVDLNLSIDTVRTHIKNIYQKLRVHSQTEAVSKAINEKLV